MFSSIERRSQLSFVSTDITDDSRFRLSVAWVVGVTRARASRLDSRPAREARPTTVTKTRGCQASSLLFIIG